MYRPNSHFFACYNVTLSPVPMVLCYDKNTIWFFVSAPHKYYIGFRYAHPLTEDAIEEMYRYVI